jgi:seryl-tRNA synthetase
MLSRDYLRENADAYRAALRNRNTQAELDRFLDLDAERRRIITTVEALKNQRNTASQEIAALKKSKQDASGQIEAMKRVGEQIKQLDERLVEVERDLRDVELRFPNVPEPSVPVGDETANRVERTWGRKPAFDFAPRPHWEIGEALGILDFDRAAKITGARFTILRGMGAKLSRALMNFMLESHARRGYTEILTPFMVNADSMTGTGQLPKFEDDLFKLLGEKLYYLIPTAEVPVTNYYRDEILDAADLTRSFCSYSPCFRSEAGSYGKDTRGLIRQHQFEKVELVKFTLPEKSRQEHEVLTADAEAILQALGLHYRVVTLSTGDMGFQSAKTYDIEVWLPGQDAFREISSCSNFLDFQARRANIRYRGEGKKAGYVHTLNGSGLPLGRTLVAILENFQQADGSVRIPEPLRPHLGGAERIGVGD